MVRDLRRSQAEPPLEREGSGRKLKRNPFVSLNKCPSLALKSWIAQTVEAVGRWQRSCELRTAERCGNDHVSEGGPLRVGQTVGGLDHVGSSGNSRQAQQKRSVVDLRGGEEAGWAWP